MPDFPDSMINVDAREDTASNFSAKVSIQTHQASAYILPRNDAEIQRMENQHYLLKRLFGDNILSPVTWKDGDKVLDACTGTAIWLLDVVNEIPEYVSLVGFDIENRLFPAQEILPQNVKLHVHSVLSLPDAWTDTFTLVHQRLVSAALRRSEWPQALNEIYRITKPGGWVELCETIRWESVDNQDWLAALGKVSDNLGINIGCAKDLEPMMRDAGFVDVCYVKKDAPIGPWGGEDGRMMSENLVTIFKGMKNRVMKVGGYSEDQMDIWLERIQREHNEREGKLACVVCFGRKPVDRE